LSQWFKVVVGPICIHGEFTALKLSVQRPVSPVLAVVMGCRSISNGAGVDVPNALISVTVVLPVGTSGTRKEIFSSQASHCNKHGRQVPQGAQAASSRQLSQSEQSLRVTSVTSAVTPLNEMSES
jgi:hypothetical protein